MEKKFRNYSRKIKKVLSATIFLCCIGLTASAIASNLASLEQRMAGAGFSPEQVVRVQEMITLAEQKGTPAETAREKVEEGIAKGVNPEMIIGALERVTYRYEFAHSLTRQLSLNKQEKKRIIQLVVDSIAAGLTSNDAKEIMEALELRSKKMKKQQFTNLIEETLRMARDLSRLGRSSEDTTNIVKQKVIKGTTARDMAAQRKSFVKRDGKVRNWSERDSNGSGGSRGSDKSDNSDRTKSDRSGGADKSDNSDRTKSGRSGGASKSDNSDQTKSGRDNNKRR